MPVRRRGRASLTHLSTNIALVVVSRNASGTKDPLFKVCVTVKTFQGGDEVQ